MSHYKAIIKDAINQANTFRSQHNLEGQFDLVEGIQSKMSMLGFSYIVNVAIVLRDENRNIKQYVSRQQAEVMSDANSVVEKLHRFLLLYIINVGLERCLTFEKPLPPTQRPSSSETSDDVSPEPASSPSMSDMLIISSATDIL
jgi:hypothetical protein